MNPLIKCAHTQKGSEPLNMTYHKRNEHWSVQASSLIADG